MLENLSIAWVVSSNNIKIEVVCEKVPLEIWQFSSDLPPLNVEGLGRAGRSLVCKAASLAGRGQKFGPSLQPKKNQGQVRCESK